MPVRASRWEDVSTLGGETRWPHTFRGWRDAQGRQLASRAGVLLIRLASRAEFRRADG